VLAVFTIGPALAANKLEIVTLSTQADKVSGGDVLARVEVPPSTRLGDVTITLNGQDITAAFSADPASHGLVGLVSGLALGKNSLEAKAKGAGTDKLEIQNHPITGPIFSGPQEQPYFCQTHQFRPYPNASFLTPVQITAPCLVPTQVDYVYRTTAGVFAVRSRRASAGEPRDHVDRPALHRSSRDGDDQPRDLPDRHPGRPGDPGPRSVEPR